MRWFPATWERPGTAFTYRLLKFLRNLQARSKVNLYDLHATLVSLVDSTGLKPPVVSGCQILYIALLTALKYRYNELTLVTRIWVHLRQIRRGGGGHAAGGHKSLVPGSLAVDCPACPHPGRNLITSSPDR